MAVIVAAAITPLSHSLPTGSPDSASGDHQAAPAGQGAPLGTASAHSLRSRLLCRPHLGGPVMGQELRAMRLAVGMTQRDLAARLAYSPAQVCAWEQGRSAIPRAVLPRLRTVLDAARQERAEWVEVMARCQELAAQSGARRRR